MSTTEQTTLANWRILFSCYTWHDIKQMKISSICREYLSSPREGSTLSVGLMVVYECIDKKCSNTRTRRKETVYVKSGGKGGLQLKKVRTIVSVVNDTCSSILAREIVSRSRIIFSFSNLTSSRWTKLWKFPRYISEHCGITTWCNCL